MAFNLSELHIVMRLRLDGYLPDGCAVAEIGAQQVDPSIIESGRDLADLGRAFGVAAPIPVLVVNRPPEALHRLAGMPMSRQIWEWLGITYTAIDIDESPECVPLDLNFDVTPKALVGRHHLVTNFGTTEHVANQLNAFKIIHDLTAIGGVMLHNVPCGRPNHGLINYTEKFFWMLARSNEYKTLIFEAKPPGSPVVIVVAMQKWHNLDFVPPIDVPNGSHTENPYVKKRYWPVFDRPAFETTILRKAREFKNRGPEIIEQEMQLPFREEALRAREAAVLQREQIVTDPENRNFSRRLRASIAQNAPFLRVLKHKIRGNYGRRRWG